VKVDGRDNENENENDKSLLLTKQHCSSPHILFSSNARYLLRITYQKLLLATSKPSPRSKTLSPLCWHPSPEHAHAPAP